MVTKITVSRSSIYSEKPLYFSEVPSIIYVKWSSCAHFFSFTKYVLPFSQDYSNSTSAVTRSALFFSYGSTPSMFSSYFLKRMRIPIKLFFIASASFLTALDWLEDIFRHKFSAEKSISAYKSSLPLPSGFATALILLNMTISLARFFL